MAVAEVLIKERDLSIKVPGFEGVYGAITIPAEKGPIDEPVFVSSESQLLRYFTPNEKVETGYDLSYFSALTFLDRADKLWVKRAIGDNYLYGGIVLNTLESETDNSAFTSGQEDPTSRTFEDDECTYIYGKNPGDWNDNIGIKLYVYRDKEEIELGSTTGYIDTGSDEIKNLSQKFVAGEPVTLSIKGGSESGEFPDGLKNNTIYYTIYGSSDSSTHSIKLAESLEDAINGTAVSLTSEGEGTMVIQPYKKVIPDGFLIEVYKKSDENTPIESIVVSRVEGAKDFYGVNMYIEDKLNSSMYISAFDNSMISETKFPKPQTQILYLNGGDSGDAVTDGDMITASEDFEDDTAYIVKVIMDGGWATVAYQKHLDAICQQRKDCVAMLSVPFGKESSSSYITDIVDYRNNVLNLGSSRSALYTPHVKVYDKWNDRNLYIAPDGYAAAAISYTAYNYEMWYPPAGHKRGIMLRALDLRRRFTKGEMSILYDNDINPNRFFPGKGIRIWGQKTLYGKSSQLNRLNVRLLAIVIEPAIAEALQNFIFDQNTKETRSMVESIIRTYMDGIKARNGVYDYFVQCNDENNLASDISNHRMNVDLFIKPTMSVEYIHFTTVFTSYGMSFGLAAEIV